MIEYIATITKNGRVTIPAAMTRRLELKPGDTIVCAFDEDGDHVTIRPMRYPSIASLGGAAGCLPAPLTWEEMRRIAREDALN